MAQPADKQSVLDLEAEEAKAPKAPQTPAADKQQPTAGSKRSSAGSTSGRSFSKRPATLAKAPPGAKPFARGLLFASKVVTQPKAGKQHNNIEFVSEDGGTPYLFTAT